MDLVSNNPITIYFLFLFDIHPNIATVYLSHIHGISKMVFQLNMIFMNT